MRATIVVGLTLMLAAFAPPERPPSSLQPTQQAAMPKSWVPEQKTEQPPVTPEVAPKRPSTYTHKPGMACEQPSSSPSVAARQFVESYHGAMAALRARQFSEAIRLAEVATAYATDARQWMSIEQIRIEAFSELGNDTELVAALDAALSATGCLPQDKLQEYRRALEQARERLR